MLAAVVFVVAMMACGSAQRLTDSYVMKDSASEFIYADEHDIALIRPVLRRICNSKNLPNVAGLGKSKRRVIIQIDIYGFTDNPCGNPNQHIVLINRGPESAWLIDYCGAPLLDAHANGLANMLVDQCAFSASAARAIVNLRSRP